MQYDFDTPINRRGTGSLKWDVSENELPLWVADMDFQTAPEVRAAIEKRALHGVFGYSIVPEDWYAAYQNWWRIRHSFSMEKDWLIFCTGVVPAISSIVRKLTTPAEKVILLTPVYNIFFNSVVNNGCQVLECPLAYEDGCYSIDFYSLEQCLSDPQTNLLIFCNPHNPVGKIWEKETLEQIGELCWKYHVTVLSDEIHCDLTAPNYGYTPFASVSEHCRENSITCIAPTKAFNLAGLQTAAVCIPNPVLRHKVWRALNTDEVAEPNAFSIDATIAAFTKGHAWLDALREYLHQNKQMASAFITEHLPEIHVIPSQATYLLWLDCTALPGTAQQLADFIRKTTGLYVSEGSQYGKTGVHFLRLNVACSRNTLEDAMQRLNDGIKQYEKQ